jgi:hypothetical protein
VVRALAAALALPEREVGYAGQKDKAAVTVQWLSLPVAKDPDPVNAYEGVSTWVEVAIGEVEKKKRELLIPIDQDEKALMASVDESFARLIRANATITAHLNSIRTVQEVQDEALRSLKLADLRDEINKRLVEASEKAEFALTKVEGVKTKVDELSTKKKELLEKRKGGSN